MLVSSDVERSSAFYRSVLGFTSGHGGPGYEQLLHNGELVMQLHDRGEEDHHGSLATEGVPLGNGVLVWFEVSDFDAAVERAQASGAPVVREVETNPNAKQREYWFKDPDGYTVGGMSTESEHGGDKAWSRDYPGEHAWKLRKR